MNTNILLGFTTDNAVVFADINLRGENQFSASFSTAHPWVFDKDDIMERIESTIEDSDKSLVLDRLEEYDCRPSELPEAIYNAAYDVVEEFMDISLYPESFRIAGVSEGVYFLSSSAGQHDTRSEMGTYVNREIYDLLHDLWDSYHLKELDEEGKAKYDKLMELIEANPVNEYEYVEKYLTEEVFA